MFKKVSIIIAAILALMISIVNATTLEEAVGIAVDRLSVNKTVDKNVLRLYKDWSYVDEKYRESMAAALFSGLLCPSDKMLSPKSDDLSPLIKGLIRFGISDNNFNAEGSFGLTDITVNHETVYIIDNKVLNNYQVSEYKYYYALLDKNKTAYIVWQPTNVKVIRLYRGKLFLQEGNKLILTSAQKSNNELWQDVSKTKYTNAVIEKGMDIKDLNITSLDKEVYILGDIYNNEIIAAYFQIEQ